MSLPLRQLALPCLALPCIVTLLFSAATSARAASSLFGHWTTADGSTIVSLPCGGQGNQALCLRIERLSPSAPGTIDEKNPNASLRRRPLCGVEIGSGFHLEGESRATGGTVYDPLSGNTYKGSMDVNGDTLKLRGYLGISLFGRTEIWHRVSAPVVGCRPA